MFSEEGMVIAGLLVGLNAIDYNVMMKGEEYDRSVSTCIAQLTYYQGSVVGLYGFVLIENASSVLAMLSC